ncbi:helix-turn-helix domain-containing protein [Paenibacillus contaminans]|uniref:Transcriptional regulator n=1 Tax=Paenibacillus contaminans TaxID=450362 RepID=A0A329MGK1_9BACL|nr:XRE family transcriptional regulator [Paenibacillus contaminans]RAV18812.1 transcriptional regulator [Paenibacillus contaminans]
MEANNRFSTFIPDRLVEAREIRGMTTTELAEEVGVSQQAISKFEKNDKSSPSFETIEKIALVLNVPVNFFYKTSVPTKEAVVFFRSKSAATVKSKKIHANKLGWIREISLYLDNLLVFPTTKIPRLIDRERFIPTEFNEIDEMAISVREMWGLGNGPISNIVLLLEKMGAVVARSPFSTYSIDACSVWHDGDRPYILLSNDKTASRSRFDIAHELGHLVLHSRLKTSEFNQKENYKRIEKEANRFASSFLLPAPSFGREIFSSTLEHLVSLKERWKVSINAIAYRAMQLEIFSEYQYIYLKNKLAQNNWLTKEPLDDELPFEEPTLLKQAFEAVVENDIKTKQDIVSELGLYREEIEAIANLEANYLLPKESGKVFAFKPKH